MLFLVRAAAHAQLRTFLHHRHASARWHLVRQEDTIAVMRGGWVYIMTNKPHGVLYTGVTAHLSARISQHRNDEGSAFCRRYGLKMLVLVEAFETIEEAIAREKRIKAWQRDWKIALIESVNSNWNDLFDLIA